MLKAKEKKYISSLEEFADEFVNADLRTMLSSIWDLFQILLTCPVTSASAERFFSVLKLLKTYLRSTTAQERLSSLALMAIEKEIINNLMTDTGLECLLNKFITKENRRMMFY